MNGYIIETIRAGRVVSACRYNHGRHATIQAARILADKTGDGVRVRAAGDVWTWDANAGADRRYYCAASRKVGFEPLEG